MKNVRIVTDVCATVCEFDKDYKCQYKEKIITDSKTKFALIQWNEYNNMKDELERMKGSVFMGDFKWLKNIGHKHSSGSLAAAASTAAGLLNTPETVSLSRFIMLLALKIQDLEKESLKIKGRCYDLEQSS